MAGHFPPAAISFGTIAWASLVKAATAVFVRESINRKRPISRPRLSPAKRMARNFALPCSIVANQCFQLLLGASGLVFQPVRILLLRFKRLTFCQCEPHCLYVETAWVRMNVRETGYKNVPGSKTGVLRTQIPYRRLSPSIGKCPHPQFLIPNP